MLLVSCRTNYHHDHHHHHYYNVSSYFYHYNAAGSSAIIRGHYRRNYPSIQKKQNRHLLTLDIFKPDFAENSTRISCRWCSPLFLLVPARIDCAHFYAHHTSRVIYACYSLFRPQQNTAHNVFTFCIRTRSTPFFHPADRLRLEY